MLLLLSLACRAVEPAPEDLDGLFHFFWQEAEEGSTEELEAAQLNLEVAAKGSSLTEPLKGTITDLSNEEAALVDVDVDASISAGMFLINPVACTLEQIDRTIWWQKQDELYPDYQNYKRDYLTDIDAYTSGESDRVSWTTSYTAGNILTGDYDSTVLGSLRKVVGAEHTFLIARAWIPAPAVFVKEGPVFDQDFQMEIFYASGDHLVHAYPLWRHLDIGSGLSTDDPGFQGTLLNELVAYDRDTEQLCADGIP